MSFFGEVAEILLTTISLLAALPVGALLAQVLLAMLPTRETFVSGRRPRVGVLVPAHNESSGILPTLAQARAQMESGDRLLVVADNCSDDTAKVARAAGAEVSERSDLQHRGKGYALAHGVLWFESDPPEVVVILDADCSLGAGCIDRIARLSMETGRPVQALNLMKAAGPELKQRIAEFAMRVKNLVRPRGMHRLGLPCGLTGTGMALPWQVARTAPLASGHLVEDMQLGIALSAQGTPPLFCESALVSSMFPANAEGEASQRRRWEHGHIALILGIAPKFLLQGLRARSLAMTVMALDLMVPPLTLLTVLRLVSITLCTLGWWAIGSVLPLKISATALAGLLMAIFIARHRFAAEILAAGDLLRVPVYVLGKVRLYLEFITRRQKQWVRTKRDCP